MPVITPPPPNRIPLLIPSHSSLLLLPSTEQKIRGGDDRGGDCGDQCSGCCDRESNRRIHPLLISFATHGHIAVCDLPCSEERRCSRGVI
jgi:hypothetical protein